MINNFKKNIVIHYHSIRWVKPDHVMDWSLFTGRVGGGGLQNGRGSGEVLPLWKRFK